MPDMPSQLRDRPVLQQKIWRRCNEKNQHFMGCFVGREGSGKSYCAIKVGELVDPNFGSENILFSPEELLCRLNEGVHTGEVFVLDEAGVGMGNRTWYDEAQILFNKVLQVIRDENAAVIFTLPRMSELDLQARGRLIGYWEMQDIDRENNIARARYKNLIPKRGGDNDILEKYPRMRIDGVERKITTMGFRKPSQSILEGYEERKDEFQEELYAEAIGEFDDRETQEDDDLSPQEIAEEIQERGIEDFLSWHGAHNKHYIDKDLIQVEFDTTVREAKTVKKLLQREDSIDPEEAGKKKETHA